MSKSKRIFADKLRELRVAKGWTQEHLAQAAGIDARTVQRAEQGKALSAESITSLAGALDVDLAELSDVVADALGRTSITPEEIQALMSDFDTKHVLVQLQPVESSQGLDVIDGTLALLFDCKVNDEKVLSLVSDLTEQLADITDVAGVASHTDIRSYKRGAFDVIAQMNARNTSVLSGVATTKVKFPHSAEFDWRTAVFLAVPCTDRKTHAWVERSALNPLSA